MATKTRSQLRVVRHDRIRKHLHGSADRPRLAVFRSLKHIYAQIIDDDAGLTLVSAGTTEKDLGATGGKEGAKAIGLALGKRAVEKGIKTVIFDRGGFKYHGQVKELADGAREAGLEF